MAGGRIVHVPLLPPASAGTKKSSAAEWTIDPRVLENAISPRTKMIVGLPVFTPVKALCVQSDIL
jgi:aspartate/methionine/tyrosine aminotransferase